MRSYVLSKRIFFLCYLGIMLFFIPNTGMGQAYDECEIDHQLLKQRIIPGVLHAEPGAHFYLSPEYSSAHNRRDLFGTVAAYYEYLRPATRKEIRQDTIKAMTVARVMSDGNVYKEVSPDNTSGFFEVTKYFEGDFDPLRRNPELLLPPGLIPFDFRPYQTQAFILQYKGKGYSLFDCRGKQVVVYADDKTMQSMFQTDDSQRQLAQKRAFARSLLGLEVHLSYDDDPTRQFIPLELADCRVARDYTIFSYWGDEVGYLYIDHETQFRLYEKGCIESYTRSSTVELSPLTETTNQLFTEIAQRKKAVKYVQENPVLLQLLMQQFELAEDNYTDITWYLHKYQTPDLTRQSSFLRANLNSNAVLYLQSNYFGKEAIDHTHVRVESGEKSMTTKSIALIESRNIRAKTSAGAEEQIHYTRGEDEGVIAFIAAHAEQPVSLVFMGSRGDLHRMDLSPENKQAIRDIYILYLLLKGE